MRPRDGPPRTETSPPRCPSPRVPAVREAVLQAEKRLQLADQHLSPVIRETLAQGERRVVAARSKLALLDPSNPLKRGYSLTLDVRGNIVRRAADVKAGDELTTRLGEGLIVSTTVKREK